jgi:hypothetical protein
VQQTDSKIALVGLVAAGVGLSVAARSTRALSHPGLVYRPLVGVALRLGMGLLLQASPSARAAAFAELARAQVPSPGESRADAG